jgi:5-methylcytosine-specific restriction endonuclease McrA
MSTLGKHWKMTAQGRENIKLGKIGKKHTKEHIENHRLSMIGKHWKLSEKAKKNHSIALKGKKKSPFSEEHKRNMRLSAKRGKENNAWKGGITPIAEIIRKSIKYKHWRQDIFLRDNFTCQKCNEKGGKLVAHHKKSFHNLIEEVKKYLPLLDLYNASMIYIPLWELDNGITLCEKCHKKIEYQGQLYLKI